MTNTEKATAALETAKKNLDKAIAKVARNEKKLAAAVTSGDEYEIRWAEMDVRRANDDLKRAQANYDKKLAALEAAKAKDAELNDMPEAVKQMIEHVKQMSFEDMMNIKAEMREMYENDREKFKKQTKWAQELTWKWEDEIKRIADMDGEAYVFDLVQRTKAVVGEITDWSYLRFSACALEGVIQGTKGKAAVFTIVAGGYNIQRRHYRVLVKRRAA
jgi:hypothetical protein